jgi:hypothetical protein
VTWRRHVGHPTVVSPRSVYPTTTTITKPTLPQHSVEKIKQPLISIDKNLRTDALTHLHMFAPPGAVYSAPGMQPQPPAPSQQYMPHPSTLGYPSHSYATAFQQQMYHSGAQFIPAGAGGAYVTTMQHPMLAPQPIYHHPLTQYAMPPPSPQAMPPNPNPGYPGLMLYPAPPTQQPMMQPSVPSLPYAMVPQLPNLPNTANQSQQRHQQQQVMFPAVQPQQQLMPSHGFPMGGEHHPWMSAFVPGTTTATTTALTVHGAAAYAPSLAPPASGSRTIIPPLPTNHPGSMAPYVSATSDDTTPSSRRSPSHPGNPSGSASDIAQLPAGAEHTLDDEEERGAPKRGLRQLIVNYLDNETTGPELLRIFSGLGVVDNARIMYDPKTNMPLGYGFVYFRDPEAARAAVASMNGYPLRSKRLKVNFANPLKQAVRRRQRSRGGSNAVAPGDESQPGESQHAPHPADADSAALRAMLAGLGMDGYGPE